MKRYYIERNLRTNVRTGFVETASNSGVFVQTPLEALAATARTPGMVLIPKPVDRQYSTANGVYNIGRNGALELPNITFVDYLRRTDKTQAQINARQEFFSQRSLSGSELTNPDLLRRTYWEISGGALQELEGTRPFFHATTQQVLNKLAATSMGVPQQIKYLQTNFESCYPLFPTSQGAMVAAYGPGNQSIVIEHDCPQKGQTLTLDQCWALGQSFFQDEERVRFANRHVAVNLWLKGLVPNAKVANGDGANVYYQRSPVFDYTNEYNSYANGTAGGNFFFYTAANHPQLSAGGITVTPAGKTLWQTQDWINNYIYPSDSELSPADFDWLQSQPAPVSYLNVWPKLKPAITRYDASLVAFDFINRNKLPGKPYTLQTHYKDEFGYLKSGTNGAEKSTFEHKLVDGSICAPWHQYNVAAITSFLGRSKEDRLKVWRTHSRYPNGGDGTTPGTADYAYNRPNSETEAYDAGRAAVKRYSEYLVASAQVWYLHQLYVKYPTVSGSGWGASAQQQGSTGYYKRSIRDAIYIDNPSDRRTKAVVCARTIVKNGSTWSLVIASNHGQNANDVTEFDILFRKADIPALTADVEVKGFKISGYDTPIWEVPLEPAKFAVTLAGSGTVVTPNPPAPGTLYGFDWLDLPSTTQPGNGVIDFIGGRIALEWRIKEMGGHKYGGSPALIKDGSSPNYVNNFDPGRRFQITYWGGPVPFVPQPASRYTISETWEGSAYNPLEDGDWTGNFVSEIQQYGHNPATGWKFLKTRAMCFHVTNFKTGFIYRKWGKVVAPNAVRHHYRVNWNRANDEVPVTGRFPAISLNEHPALFANDILYLVKYPTETGIATADMREFTAAKGKYRGFRDVLLAKPWFALVGADGKGVGVIGPNIGMLMGGQEGDGGGGEFGYGHTYVGAMRGLNLDEVGEDRFTFDYVVGTLSEIETYCNNYLIENAAWLDFVPNYNFATGRHGWYCLNGTFNDEGTAGAMQVTRWGTEGVTLKSPPHPFQAAAVSTLYIRIKNNSTANKMRLVWIKPNQAETPALQNGQFVEITVPNNGQWQTVSVPMTGKPGWAGIVAQLALTLVSNTPGSSEVGQGLLYEVSYIGKNNPTP